MDANQIKALLEASIDQAEVEVTIDGSHINLVVISPAFAGVRPVKKQQMVYAVLNEAIVSGAIHAVHMKTYTPEEWANR